MLFCKLGARSRGNPLELIDITRKAVPICGTKVQVKTYFAPYPFLVGLNYFGTSAADFIQIVGFIGIVVLALFLLV